MVPRLEAQTSTPPSADSPAGLRPPSRSCSGVGGRWTWVGGEKVQPTVGRRRKSPLGPEKRNCWLGPLSLSFLLTHTLPGEEGIQTAWFSTGGRVRQALNMLSGKS